MNDDNKPIWTQAEYLAFGEQSLVAGILLGGSLVFVILVGFWAFVK